MRADTRARALAPARRAPFSCLVLVHQRRKGPPSHSSPAAGRTTLANQTKTILPSFPFLPCFLPVCFLNTSCIGITARHEHTHPTIAAVPIGEEEEAEAEAEGGGEEKEEAVARGRKRRRRREGERSRGGGGGRRLMSDVQRSAKG